MSSTQPAAGGATARGAAAGPVQRHLGLALVVIATAQLMVVLYATGMNVALPHIQCAPGFCGSGLWRDAAAGSGGIRPVARCDRNTGVQR